MMMDELELLKKDWKKKDEHLPKLSFDELYKMIWKKSSSIVKWIFYISIAEFLFWIAISLIPIDNGELSGDKTSIFNTLELALKITSFSIILFFMFKFYQNYKKINTTDSARELIKKIIAVRKTVMQYVWFNLGLLAVSFVLLTIGTFIYDPTQLGLTEKIAAADNKVLLWGIIIIALLFTIILLGGILWLFYKLLYGILLKKLNTNYKELKKLEI